CCGRPAGRWRRGPRRRRPRGRWRRGRRGRPRSPPARCRRRRRPRRSGARSARRGRPAIPRAWPRRSARRCRAAWAGRRPPIEDGPGWSTGPTAKGKGSGAEKLISSAALTGWAADTGN
ncbi:MAG: hypothetical protein AVDCRST_MAG08-2826, partial [uncultured Acetobacteraceae bacterium]